MTMQPGKTYTLRTATGTLTFACTVTYGQDTSRAYSGTIAREIFTVFVPETRTVEAGQPVGYLGHSWLTNEERKVLEVSEVPEPLAPTEQLVPEHDADAWQAFADLRTQLARLHGLDARAPLTAIVDELTKLPSFHEAFQRRRKDDRALEAVHSTLVETLKLLDTDQGDTSGDTPEWLATLAGRVRAGVQALRLATRARDAYALKCVHSELVKTLKLLGVAHIDTSGDTPDWLALHAARIRVEVQALRNRVEQVCGNIGDAPDDVAALVQEYGREAVASWAFTVDV